MSIFYPDYSSGFNDLDSLAKSLWDSLKPLSWPFSLDELPIGSALVGGAVRDGLLASVDNNPDLDFIVPSDAVILAQKLSNRCGGTCVILDQERDIARLVIKNWTIDFAKQIGDALNEDLSRRDFTINAIALTLGSQPKLVDPFNGIKDLKNKILVAISEENLVEDPLRLLRAFRLMSELNLSINQETQVYLNRHAKLLNNVAPERIKNEIQRLIKASCADKAIFALYETRLLDLWRYKSKVFISQFDYLQDSKNFDPKELRIALPLARLVNLLTDQGLQSLKFSRKDILRCQNLRKWREKNDGVGFQTLKESDLFQLHIELESCLPALIIQLPKEYQLMWLTRWRDPKDALFHPSSPLDGNALKKILGVPEGPIIGEIIKHLSIEKAFNRLQNREEAVQLARNLWKQKQPLL